jgi:hypothetical protein
MESKIPALFSCVALLSNVFSCKEEHGGNEMIKKTRNAFLAAAVATLGFGCVGGPNDPLDLTDNPNALGGVVSGSQATSRAIAQLLGGAFSQLADTTSSVFGTLNAVTSTGTGLGSILPKGLAAPTAQASGAVLGGSIQNCSLGGTSIFTIDTGALSTDTDFNALLSILADTVVEVSINMNSVGCNEPVHEDYDGVNGAPTLETDANGAIINNFIDGGFALSLRSKPNANNIGFSLNASIEMKNYLFQRYSEGTTPDRPNSLSGAIDLSLQSTDTSYAITMSTDIVNSNTDTDGYVTSALLMDGELDISDSFGIGAYDLGIDGRLRNYSPAGSVNDSHFQVFTIQNIVRTAGIPNTNMGDPTLGGILGVPSMGVLGLNTRASDGSMETSTATVTATGLNIVTVVDGLETMYSCTWNEVNGVNGATCGG